MIADILITWGWTQRTLMNNAGNVCLVGAARIAGGQHPQAGRLPNGWRRVLNASIPPEYRSVEQFNDAPETTYDDVLRVAKEADEILDAISPSPILGPR